MTEVAVTPSVQAPPHSGTEYEALPKQLFRSLPRFKGKGKLSKVAALTLTPLTQGKERPSKAALLA